MNTDYAIFRYTKNGLLLVAGLLLTLSARAAEPQHLPIQLVFSFTAPTCAGYTNGDATVTPSGSTAPYTYQWNNGQQGQTNYGLGAGTYSVTVTAANGEVATGSVTLTQPAPVNATISASGVDCDGPPVTLTAAASGGTGAYTFGWSTGANGVSITANTAGTYFVTATDANGCLDNATIQVEAASEFSMNYQFTPPSCAGNNNGSITATAYGNYPPFSYAWSTGATGPTVNNLTAGTYVLTVTDARNCTFVDNVILTGSSQLVVNVTATDILCAVYPNGGAVTATVSGGVAPYTYQWSNNNNQPGQQNLPAGIYSVTVTDQNGCMAVDGDTISIPPPLDGQVVTTALTCDDSTGCITVQGIGGTPPYTYNWPALGLAGPTQCGLPPGVYYVCIFDANLCQHDLNVTLDSVSTLGVTLLTTKAECVGVNNGTATAMVTPPGGNYQYQWNIQNSPPVAQLNGIPAGTNVCVTVTDLNTGCQGTACAVIATHTILSLQVTDVDVACAGDSTGSATAIASNGTSPYTYVWTYPDNSQVNGSMISNLAAGAYAVLATDSLGCKALSVADIGVLSDLNAAFNITTLDCIGDTVVVQFTDASTDSLSTIVQWSWTFVSSSGTVQSTQQNPPPLSFTQNTTGIATLVVTSAAGCVDSIQAPFTVTGIPDFSVNVPNPAVDCQNDPIPITVNGAPGLSYVWSPTTGLTFVNGNPQNVIADPDSTTTYTLTVSGGACSGQAQVTIIRVTPLELTLADASVETCDSLVTLSVTLNTAANVVWYNSNGDSIGNGLTLTIPAGPITTYTAVGVAAYGCADTAAATVTGIGVEVAVVLPPPGTICAGAPIQLQATNLDPSDNLTYQWTVSPAAGVVFTPSANVANPVVTAPAGNYVFTLTATNQSNCTETLSVPLNVQVGASLAGLIQKDVCNGLQVSFFNNSNISGVWYFGNGDSSLVNDPIYSYAQAGNYTVQFIPDQACVLPYTENITVAASSNLTAAIGVAQTACAGAATLQFTDETLGNPVSWQWSFPGGNPATSSLENPAVTFNQDGNVTATLIVTNALGCADTTAQTVPFNVINDDISNANVPCIGNQVALNPDFNVNYTYQWSAQPLDNDLIANSPNPVVSPDVPTVYTVTITNGSCIVVDSALVTPSSSILAAIAANQTDCNGAATLQFTDETVGNPVSWQWSFPGGTPATSNQQNPTVTFNQDGTVTATLIVTNASGCADTTSQQVSVNLINDDIAPAASFCAGEAVALNPVFNAAYTYQWTSNPADPNLETNSPNPVVSPAATTTYFVTIANGSCTVLDTATVTVAPALLITAINVDQTNCFGTATLQFASLTNGTPVSWQWSFPGGNPQTSSAQNPVVNFSQDGLITATLIVNNAANCPDTATTPITINLINDDIANPGSFCTGESVALNPDFNAAYTYQWTSNPADPNLVANSPNPVVSPAGTTTYFVTIVNGACTVQDTATVTVATALTAGIGVDQQNCVGTATLQFTDQTSGGLPTSWQWSFPGGNPQTSTTQNPVVNFSQDGQITATLIVNNAANCPDTVSVPVAINVIDDDITNPGSFCAGESVALNPDFNANYAYQWSSNPADPNLATSSPNPIVSPAGTTTYFVTIVNGACTVQDTATVTVAAAPSAAIDVAQINCLGEATLQFTDQTVGEVSTWQWSFPGGNPATSNLPNPMVTFNQDGTVTALLIVTNAAGCSDTVSQEVAFTLIDDLAVNSGAFCPGESVSLNPDFNGNYTYQWTAQPADTTLMVNTPNPVVKPSVPTNYYVTITNGLCVVLDTATVTPNPAATLELPADTTLCSADSLTLNVMNSNGIQFAWSESLDFDTIFATGTSATIRPERLGVYYVRTVNAFNCPAIDSILVNNATVGIEAEPSQRDLCLGSSAELTITNLQPGDTLTYIWTPNLPAIPNPTVEPAVSTVYTALVTNQFGCQDTATFTVNVVTLAIAAQVTGKAVICPGDTTTLVVTPSGGANAYTYAWSPDFTLSAPNDSLTLAFPEETTTYTVTVTAVGTDCSATADVTVTLMSGECVEPFIFVPKAFTPNNDSNNDFFRVRGVNIKEIYFVVFDRWGEKVYETEDPNHTGWDGSFNNKELTPDAYGWFLRATCGNGATYTSKGDVTLLK